MVVEFETEHLVVSPLTRADLPDALSSYLSRPEYLELAEGSVDNVGHYDMETLEREWELAEATPGRVFAGIRVRAAGELVGLLDWLERNPNDGHPWIGLIVVGASFGRRGYAREAVEGLLAATAWPVVREGVIASNRQGLALAEALGSSRTTRPS
jgi:RimJ/RimL family protein N-acetyltransferase